MLMWLNASRYSRVLWIGPSPSNETEFEGGRRANQTSLCVLGPHRCSSPRRWSGHVVEGCWQASQREKGARSDHRLPRKGFSDRAETPKHTGGSVAVPGGHHGYLGGRSRNAGDRPFGTAHWV